MTKKSKSPRISAAAPQAGASVKRRSTADETVGQIAADRIRERAYEIYKARNGNPGNESLDWLQAERELSGEGDHHPTASVEPPIIVTHSTAAKSLSGRS